MWGQDHQKQIMNIYNECNLSIAVKDIYKGKFHRFKLIFCFNK